MYSDEIRKQREYYGTLETIVLNCLFKLVGDMGTHGGLPFLGGGNQLMGQSCKALPH
jgi:hypothetical protein